MLLTWHYYKSISRLTEHENEFLFFLLFFQMKKLEVHLSSLDLPSIILI